MSVADKLSYLRTTKQEIRNAIETQGVSVSDSDTFRSYKDKIMQIATESEKIWLFNTNDATPAFNSDILGSYNTFAQMGNSRVWRIYQGTINCGNRIWDGQIQTNMQSIVFTKIINWSRYTKLHMIMSFKTSTSYEYNQFAIGTTTNYPTNYNNAVPESSRRIYMAWNGYNQNYYAMGKEWEIDVSSWPDSYLSIYKCDGIFEISKLWLEQVGGVLFKILQGILVKNTGGVKYALC